METLHPVLAARFQRIEDEKARFIKAAADLGESLGRDSRLRNGWSPNQLLQHLQKAEAVQLDEIAAAAIATEERKRRKGWLVACLVFILSRRVRVPAPVSMTPDLDVDPVDVIGKWDAERDRLREILSAAAPNTFVSKHAILGWLTADDVLKITEAHLLYHGKDL